MRKKVFICSPFRGDMERNARKAAYSRMACEEGYLPIALHLLFPQFLNEGMGLDRAIRNEGSTGSVYDERGILSI